MRRITKHLRDGKEIGVVTDLLDEVKYPAEAMLTTYHSHCRIETVFHQITDVFSLRHLIGTMPKALLFQMSFYLLMHNARSACRVATWLRIRHVRSKKISNEKPFYEAKPHIVAFSELVEVDSLLALLGEVPTAAELRECMREGLPGARGAIARWKASSSGHCVHQKVTTRVLGNHTSTHRVLEQTRKQKHQAPTAPQRP